MCHRVTRTICPSCLRPTAYPQRQRLDQCFSPKVYTGWVPATAMYEKHRTEEETIPEVCNRCRYLGLWTWYGQGNEREEETRENDMGKKEVEEADEEAKKVVKGKGKGKKKVNENVKNVEWSTTEGEEKGSQNLKGCGKEEKEKLPKKAGGKRKAGGVVDQAQQPEEVETKRRRFP